MANINVAAGDALLTGTTGDDLVTLDTDALGFTANLDGNGGDDTLTLSNAADALGTIFLGANAAVSYDAATDTWTIDDDTTADTAATLTEGFNSVTFSDGVTLEAGVASSGSISPTSVLSGATHTLTTVNEYDWTGTAASTSTFTADSIISVDGMDIATVGSNFTNASGAFSVNSAAETVDFTADTAAIAAQGNVGEEASFTFDVVVADSTTGEERTVSVTWTAPVPFTTGDDISEGTDSNDTHDGQAGDDLMSGGDGNDALTGGAGNDTLNGDDGIDNLVGGAGDDELFGGEGNDVLNESTDTGATAGSNMLSGGAGSDVLTGGDGNDVLRGGGDNDNLTGGNGNDTLFGGNGDDGTLVGGNGDDVINGGAGTDVLDGGEGADTLKGGDGDDNLTGGNGDDELRGGEGTDILSGGAGKDFLYTSVGDNEQLTGDAGNDTFILKAGTGTTEITDFTSGDDKIDVSALGYNNLDDVLANAYELGGAGAGVVLEIDADTSVTITGATLAGLDDLDFNFA